MLLSGLLVVVGTAGGLEWTIETLHGGLFVSFARS